MSKNFDQTEDRTQETLQAYHDRGKPKITARKAGLSLLCCATHFDLVGRIDYINSIKVDTEYIITYFSNLVVVFTVSSR